MATSNSTSIDALLREAERRNRAFLVDTLTPWLGGQPEGGVAYHVGQIPGASITATGESHFPGFWARLFGDKETVNIKVDNPSSEQRTLVHEFAHIGAGSRDPSIRRLEVPLRVWRDLMTPRERERMYTEYAGYPGDASAYEEDFAWKVEDIFTVLRQSATLPENNALKLLNTLQTKRERYMAARLLTRRNSPFYNHPHRAVMLESLRRKAATDRQRTTATDDTPRNLGAGGRERAQPDDERTRIAKQKVENAVNHFVFSGTQIHNPTGGSAAISRLERERRYGDAYARMNVLVGELAEIIGKREAERYRYEVRSAARRRYGLKGD